MKAINQVNYLSRGGHIVPEGLDVLTVYRYRANMCKHVARAEYDVPQPDKQKYKRTRDQQAYLHDFQGMK